MSRISHEVLHVIGAVAAFALAAAPLGGQEQQEIDWRFTAQDWRGQVGKSFNVFCQPATARGGSLWGVDVYTDDSSICMAAVHSLATFDLARGGTVYFRMEPGQEGYDGDRRRGVQGSTYGAWPGGFRIVGGVPGKRLREINDSTPLEITWSSSARHLRGNDGAQWIVLCPRGGRAQVVWGNSVYADESSICTAAVHAGLITFADGGSVTLRVEAGREGYQGTKKHGVTTLPWEKWEGSFTFPKRQVAVELPAPGADLPAPPPTAVRSGVALPTGRPDAAVRQPTGDYLVTWTTNAEPWQGAVGTIIAVYCPPGGRAVRVWGSVDYTSDSSICTAAVHALATFDFTAGGTAYITMTRGLPNYASEIRRGVTSTAYDAFPGSFRVMAGVPGKRPSEIGDTTVTELSWSTTAEHLRGKNIERKFLCPSEGRSHNVWGTDVYTDQSSICSAAVHAGMITRAAGGSITVRIEAGQNQYSGTTRNDVASQPFGTSGGSFSFRR